MKTTPMRTNESAAGSTRLLHRLTAALLALVLAASAALPVFAADTAPTDTIYINSVSDLLAFADKCGFDQWSKGKTVILQEDLSLEDTEWAPVASFSGAAAPHALQVQVLPAVAALVHILEHGFFALVRHVFHHPLLPGQFIQIAVDRGGVGGRALLFQVGQNVGRADCVLAVIDEIIQDELACFGVVAVASCHAKTFFLPGSVSQFTHGCKTRARNW